MYSENSYKNYIFWLKVKQIFLLLLFSIIGCVIGRFIGQYLVEVLLFDVTKLYISVTVSTLIFFGIAALMTSGTAKEVQEAYWRIAVLRKLTVISKKLDSVSSETKKVVKKELKKVENDIVEDNESSSHTAEDVNIIDDMIGE